MKRLFSSQRGIAAILIVVFVVLGILVVGTVAGLAVLSNDVVFTVNNNSCGTLDVAQGTAALKLNFLPGINIPSQIAQGETAVVQLPKTLVTSVTVNTGSIEVVALGQSYSIGTSSVDMDQSKLDGTPLSGLVGQTIDLSKDHTLDLACK